MGDNIWLPDRNGVRTPMQWTAGLNAGFSEAAADALYTSPLADPEYGYHLVNVVAEQAEPASVWQTLRHLIAARKQHPAFGHGDRVFLPLANKAVLAVRRSYQAETIVAVHNLSSAPQSIELDLPPWRGRQVRDVLADRDRTMVGEASHQLNLGPYEYTWLSLVES
jgi:maltose alpha-D-glucosyltransferase/alpha-amylase